MIRTILPPPPLPARLLPVLLLLALGGCSPSYSPDTYASAAVQQASKVEQGVIVGLRRVAVQAPGTTGAVTGAAAGGILGSQAQVGTALTTLGGTVVGGIVGTGIERATGDTTAFEYVVRKGNGELVSVTQRDKDPLSIGQKVLVIAGPQARIVADYTVPSDAHTPDSRAAEARTAEAKPGDAGPAEPAHPPAPTFTPLGTGPGFTPGFTIVP